MAKKPVKPAKKEYKTPHHEDMTPTQRQQYVKGFILGQAAAAMQKRGT